MTKAIRVKSPPKTFKHTFTINVHDENWTEDETVAWIKRTCIGTVSFRPLEFRNYIDRYNRHEITFWFTKKQDAMLFKLEFMVG